MSKIGYLFVVLLVVALTPTSDAANIFETLWNRFFGPNIPEKPDIRGRLLTSEEGCGNSTVTTNRIVGGGPAKVGAWPWMALIGYKNATYFSLFCGGSLISTRHVLSAAHCFLGQASFVRLGEHDKRTTTDGQHTDVDIVRIANHPHYDHVLKINDVSIVHMAHDVEFTPFMRPICLPITESTRTMSLEGTSPFVAGWGHTREKHISSNVLLQVQVAMVRAEDCKNQYQKASRLYHFHAEERFNGTNILCAGSPEGGKDACQGDSGGPLMTPVQENKKFVYYQYGVVSWGMGCARPNIPGVYANVLGYIDWIMDHMQSEKNVQVV